MFTLPLLAPGVCETLAVHYLDRGAPAALYRSAQWNGVWPGPSPTGGSATGDVLAWVMVAFFLLTMGVIAGCIIALRSRPAGSTPEQLLIEEVQQNEDALARGSMATEGEPWERDPDWWRKGGGERKG